MNNLGEFFFSSPIDPFDLEKDWGRSDDDQRHRLVVHGALLIEPTETESKETLDAFAETLFRITGEDPQLLHEAPHTTLISRPDTPR